MKVLYLIRKDILLIQKYFFLLLLLGFGIPVFLSVQIDIGGAAALLITSLYLVALTLQMISLAEMKYPKAQARLCAGAYTRKNVVAARYAVPVFLFIYAVAAHIICTFFIEPVGRLTLLEIGVVLLVISVFTGIYIPMEYKFGYQKSKYIYMIAILFSPILIPRALSVDFLSAARGILRFGAVAPHIILLVVAAAILAISFLCAVYIFEKKDLA